MIDAVLLFLASVVFGISLTGTVLAFFDKFKVPPVVSLTMSLIAVLTYFVGVKDVGVMMAFTFISVLSLIVELFIAESF